MKKTRGFKIARRIFRIPILLKTRIRNLNPSRRVARSKPVARLIAWGRSLTRRARLLCFSRRGSGYARMGQEKPDPVPKGHLAIYVGQSDDGDFHRVLVPVVYFNHPLFCELLREAEEEYGFCQEGGIMIPCPFSDFEKVQTRITAGSSRRRMRWRRHL